MHFTAHVTLLVAAFIVMFAKGISCMVSMLRSVRTGPKIYIYITGLPTTVDWLSCDNQLIKGQGSVLWTATIIPLWKFSMW